jgi:hypothetical protein
LDVDYACGVSCNTYMMKFRGVDYKYVVQLVMILLSSLNAAVFIFLQKIALSNKQEKMLCDNLSDNPNDPKITCIML